MSFTIEKQIENKKQGIIGMNIINLNLKQLNPENLKRIFLQQSNLQQKQKQQKSTNKRNKVLLESMQNIKQRNNPQTAPGKQQSSASMQQLLQQFNKIDHRKQGSIKLSQASKLIKIYITKKNRKTQLIPKQKLDINFDDVSARIIFNHQNQVTFDQFLAMLYEVEIDLQIHKYFFLNIGFSNLSNQNMVQFLHLLEDYRKKCQEATEYLQAEKAHQKILQIKNKQMKRHKQKLLYQQKTKVSSVNSLQQSKILQFNGAWNDYMEKYEDAAMNSIEKLKAKHLRQMQEQQQRIRSYYENYLKPSKKIIDLRVKQKNLVKQRQYQQAERIKQYTNKLFQKQRQIKTQEISERIKKRKQTLQKHQQIALLAHLKRIQKDRNQQMMQRQTDSSTMLIKLRNLQNDLVQKQSVQIKQTLDNLRQTMCLTSSQLFGSRKMKSLGKLEKTPQQLLNQSQNKIIVQQRGGPKQKTTFKIRVNSFHRIKMDNSMYDP